MRNHLCAFSILQPGRLRAQIQRVLPHVLVRLTPTPSTVGEIGNKFHSAFIMVTYNTFTFIMVANNTFTFLMVANNTFTFIMVANNTFTFITILFTFIIVANNTFTFFSSESVASVFNLVGLLVSPAPTKITFTATAAPEGVSCHRC